MHSRAGSVTLLGAFQADHDTLFKRAVREPTLIADRDAGEPGVIGNRFSLIPAPAVKTMKWIGTAARPTNMATEPPWKVPS